MSAPLAGVRILDFSRQLAGAAGTRYLANLGAEVLRVEWPEPPGLDFVRNLMPADGVPGPNRGAMFNALNVDKRSFTLNMATDEGRRLARELVKISDVVYENMTPRVMRQWGLDDASIRSIKPDIVNVSCSGFGQTGPASGYRSYGSPSAAHTGIAHLAGLPGRPPAGWGFQIGDTHAAVNNAMTVLMALHYRRRTGRGVYIDSAQTQVNVTLLHEQLLDHSVRGTTTRVAGYPPGNDRLVPPVAPHNVYPCVGPDSWCAIAVFDDTEWAALREAMGDPEWAAAPELATAAGRWAQRGELDLRVAEWTRAFDRHALARALQDAGVAAAPVEDARDRLDRDEQLAHRGTFALYHHPEVGPRRHETIAFRSGRWEYEPWRAAPCLGEDNAYVLGTLLGLEQEELARLHSAGVIWMPDTERAGADTPPAPSADRAQLTTERRATQPEARALEGLLVVELGDESTQLAGKLLADMGATVVKVEPPGGGAVRHTGPFRGEQPDPDQSVRFWASNTSKDSVVFDPANPNARGALRDLVARADVVLDDDATGSFHGLTAQETMRGAPGLVWVSITAFGASGPRAAWKGSDLVCWAAGGGSAMLGYDDPETPPLVPQGDLSYQLAAQWAVIGALAALAARDRDGRGDFVDVSVQEAVAFAVDGYATAPYEYLGTSPRRADFAKLVPTGDDRYLMAQMLNIPTERWEAFRAWLVEVGELGPLAEVAPADFEKHMPMVLDAVTKAAASRTATDLVELGQSFGFTWMAVNGPEDLVDDPQLVARGFFRTVEHPELGCTFRYAGPGAEWSEAAWAIRNRAPLLGEHKARWGFPES